MLNLLYLGDTHPSSTSAHRAHALSRLGHSVLQKNPNDAFQIEPYSNLWNALNFRTGYRLIQIKMLKWIKQLIKDLPKPDLIWIDSGEYTGPACLKALKHLGCPIILYNIDDPTGTRDGRRFDLLKKSISLYDLVVVVRKETEKECHTLGAKNVMRVLRSYDEVAHSPFPDLSDIPEKFRSEVAFIGTWMRNEKRDEFLLHLIKKGVPVSIWGDSWQKSRHFSSLQQHVRGTSLGGRDYIAAIQGAKICLGLLSKGNRDLHTTRSFEIPYAGGLLCAQRTSEHEELYRESVEAVFWSDAEECARVCNELLKNEGREDLRLAGMKRVRSLQVGNEDICQKIINQIFTNL